MADLRLMIDFVCSIPVLVEFFLQITNWLLFTIDFRHVFALTEMKVFTHFSASMYGHGKCVSRQMTLIGSGYSRINKNIHTVGV